jgi:hypothetical protein
VSMIPEILEGCGLIVEPGDVAALSAAIGRLIDIRRRLRCWGRGLASAASSATASTPRGAPSFPWSRN